MALNRQTSVAVGLATMGLVAVVYGQFCPKVADLRVGRPEDHDAAAAEKAARWTAGAFVVGISLITQDPTVFIMGGGAVVGFSWLHRHANMSDPSVGRAYAPTSAQSIHAADGVSAGYTPSR